MKTNIADPVQEHSLLLKIEFLHNENSQLRSTIEDLNTVINLNKQQVKFLMENSNQQDQEQSIVTNNKVNTLRDQENKIKALKLVIESSQKEADYYRTQLEKVQKERDFAQGKALINEEISFAAEKNEKLLVSQLESTIVDLQKQIQQQSQKIFTLEKESNQQEPNGVIIKYRDVIHPNTQTILMHEEMEVLHALIVKLQIQINYLKSIQLKLISSLHVFI